MMDTMQALLFLFLRPGNEASQIQSYTLTFKCSDHVLVYGYTLCSSLHNGTLLVYSTDPGRDSGEYVCQAVNKAGMAQSTVLVIVTA